MAKVRIDLSETAVDELEIRIGGRRVVMGLEGAPRAAPAIRARFKSDGEVVRFLTEHADGRTIDWLTAEAKRRFGEARAPSRSAIGRFVARLRRQHHLPPSK